MAKISIIMPVYNSAQYLEESLQSIQSQTFQDYELICVNDASKDESLSILRKFQKQDNRIIIINHEMNYGAGISRNDGLKIAKGEFVIFLDSDDLFHRCLLEIAYKNAVMNNADIVVFGSEQINVYTSEVIKMGYPSKIIDYVEKKALFLSQVRHVPWDKLVKRNFLLENEIWFQDIQTNNDIFFSFATVLSAKKIVVCDEILVKYICGRSGSLTAIRTTKKSNIIEAFYALYPFCINREIDEHLKVACMNLITDNIQAYLSNKTYPVEIRRDSLDNLLRYQDMMGELHVYALNNQLYPHNQKFIEKLIKNEDVCNLDYVRYYIESIKDIIDEKRYSHKRIALWGCGQNGKKLLDIIQKNNISIDYVVDENEEKQGQTYGKYKICVYDEIKDKVDTILITNLEYKDAIENRAIEKEVIYVWK